MYDIALHRIDGNIPISEKGRMHYIDIIVSYKALIGDTRSTVFHLFLSLRTEKLRKEQALARAQCIVEMFDGVKVK